MTHSSSHYPWPQLDVDSPQTSGALTVWQIRGGGRGDDYMLLATAVEKGIARVTEVDGGSVPEIEIVNKGKLPLLGVQGEEYQGAKQNRSLNISILAGPGRTRIPVTCVEQGRWDNTFGDFKPGGYESSEIRLAKTLMLSQTMKMGVTGMERYAADQGRVWDAVEEVASAHGVDSPTSALSDVYRSKDVRREVDEIAGGIDLPSDVRGAVVAIGGRIVASDVFESSKVFASVWPRMLEGFALSALGQKGVPPSTEAAESFVAEPAGLDWVAAPSAGLGEDVRWESRRVLATALFWEGRVLHASVFGRK